MAATRQTSQSAQAATLGQLQQAANGLSLIQAQALAVNALAQLQQAQALAASAVTQLQQAQALAANIGSPPTQQGATTNMPTYKALSQSLSQILKTITATQNAITQNMKS